MRLKKKKQLKYLDINMTRELERALDKELEKAMSKFLPPSKSKPDDKEIEDSETSD